MKQFVRVTRFVGHRVTSMVFAASMTAALCTSARAQVLSYPFNETGTQAAATGSVADGLGNPKLNFTGNFGGTADLHSADGGGVSGLPGDRAFDNTSSSGIIGAAHAQHPADFDAIDAFNSFTLTGWFRLPATATESLGRQAALIENSTISVLDAPGGYRLRGGPTANSGTLELRVNRDNSVESSAAYNEIGQWVYFAVSYDGTLSSNNVLFYKGTTNGSVSLVDTLSLNAGPVAQENIPLTLGVTQTSGLTLNSFSGFLDNVRIYGEVAPLATLESARLADAAVIPEPSLTAIGLVAVLGMTLATLKQRRAAKTPQV